MGDVVIIRSKHTLAKVADDAEVGSGRALSPAGRTSLMGWSPDPEHRLACRSEPARGLMRESEFRMLQPARDIGREVRPIGVSPPPVGRLSEIVHTPDGPWKIVDYRLDPTRAQYQGRLPLPDDVLGMLRAWDAAGARPDYVAIGHQLPASWREGDPIPLVPAPRRLRERDDRLTRQLEAGTRLLATLVGGLLLIAAAPLIMPAVAVSGTGAGGAQLDPIIFAGVQHPSLPLVEWGFVCSWEWE